MGEEGVAVVTGSAIWFVVGLSSGSMSSGSRVGGGGDRWIDIDLLSLDLLDSK